MSTNPERYCANATRPAATKTAGASGHLQQMFENDDPRRDLHGDNQQYDNLSDVSDMWTDPRYFVRMHSILHTFRPSGD
jgi:hypothetical protein